ncbi:MAG TPA: beta-propeller fold lactonase family protein, partial [Neobacillus sp.]
MTTNSNYIGYIGTYTKGESKGIYSFSLDTEAQTINQVKIAAQLENPTYLTIDKDNRYLYSVIKKG